MIKILRPHNVSKLVFLILHYPSSYAGCICVGAIRYDQTRPFCANYGLDLEICALGGYLSVDQNLDGYKDGICQQSHDGTNFSLFQYAFFQGTSCAAAHAYGVAAQVLSFAGGLLTPASPLFVLDLLWAPTLTYFLQLPLFLDYEFLWP